MPEMKRARENRLKKLIVRTVWPLAISRVNDAAIDKADE
jgi:hypothetical protein